MSTHGLLGGYPTSVLPPDGGPPQTLEQAQALIAAQQEAAQAQIRARCGQGNLQTEQLKFVPQPPIVGQGPLTQPPSTLSYDDVEPATQVRPRPAEPPPHVAWPASRSPPPYPRPNAHARVGVDA